MSTALSTTDLLKFSLGIANGMKFLTTKNVSTICCSLLWIRMLFKYSTMIILLCQVIHGDLAARNILLSEQMEVKIGDFGLSRQLIDYSNYVKKTQVRGNSIISSFSTLITFWVRIFGYNLFPYIQRPHFRFVGCQSKF